MDIRQCIWHIFGKVGYFWRFSSTSVLAATRCCPIMKLISDYKFGFYTSKMNEICLHRHWLYFSSIILSFGQCVRWLIAIFVLNSSEVISFFGNVLVTHWVSIHLWKRSLRWKIVESWPRGHTSSEAATLFGEKFTYLVAKVAKGGLISESFSLWHKSSEIGA